MDCTCMLCGNHFYSKRNAMICDPCRTRKCAVCGKEFKIDPSQLDKTTCSRACKSKLTQMIREGKSSAGFKKICKYCGKEFIANHNRRDYCYDDHYATCKICGKKFKIKHMDAIPETCSEKCKLKLMEQTTQERYGVSHVFQSEDFKENAKKTILEKYGVDNVSKNEDIKKKIKETFIERYGVDNPLKTPELHEKRRQTMMSKYGVENILESDYGKEKFKETMISRYGVEHALDSDRFKEKMRQTSIEKYGAENYAQTQEYRDRVKQTCLEKYGFENQSLTRIQDFSKVDNWIEFKENPETFIDSHFDHDPSITELCKECGVNDTTIGNIINAHSLRHRINRTVSSLEFEVLEFLKENTHLNIEIHNRQLIHPYEIDIYIPDLKFGIEIDPTYTHNSSFPDRTGECKSHNYHKMKTDRCKEIGIELFHLFGYDWTCNQDIIKSMLLSRLKESCVTIYGRQTEIDPNVSFDESKKFLIENHRQGFCPSSIRIGLRCEGELVSLMTFGRSRNSVSDRSYCDYELLRFCSKKYTNVVGGASKLFKFATNEILGEKTIVSYSDRARTSGNIYKVLGFKLDHISEPGYVWVNMNTDRYVSRIAAQKHNIQKLFPDENIDLLKSEIQIMESHNYARVYDSGTCVWTYGRS